MTLPKEISERILKDASDMADKLSVNNDYQNGYKQGCEDGHIAGATEWAGRAQGLVDALNNICNKVLHRHLEDGNNPLANELRNEALAALAKYKEVSNG